LNQKSPHAGIPIQHKNSMRWLGLAKAGLQVRLAAIASNLLRTATPISAAA
jgi:IS5 family transposase